MSDYVPRVGDTINFVSENPRTRQVRPLKVTAVGEEHFLAIDTTRTERLAEQSYPVRVGLGHWEKLPEPPADRFLLHWGDGTPRCWAKDETDARQNMETGHLAARFAFVEWLS